MEVDVLWRVFQRENGNQNVLYGSNAVDDTRYDEEIKGIAFWRVTLDSRETGFHKGVVFEAEAFRDYEEKDEYHFTRNVFGALELAEFIYDEKTPPREHRFLQSFGLELLSLFGLPVDQEDVQATLLEVDRPGHGSELASSDGNQEIGVDLIVGPCV